MRFLLFIDTNFLLNFFFVLLQSPNIVATPLGLVQLVLYCKYRKSGVTEESNNWDIEQNTEKSIELQLVTNNVLIEVEAL